MTILDGKRVDITLRGQPITDFKGLPNPVIKNDETEVYEPVEWAEVLKVINSDKVDTDTRMTEADFKSILDISVFGAYLSYDTLMVLRFLPQVASFLTRQGKRLSVSVNGQGRKDNVNILRGLQEEKQATTFGEKVSNMFKPKDKGE